jgi:hypothetical protein
VSKDFFGPSKNLELCIRRLKPTDLTSHNICIDPFGLNLPNKRENVFPKDQDYREQDRS